MKKATEQRIHLMSRLNLSLKIRYFFPPSGIIGGSFARMGVGITLFHGANLGFKVLFGGLGGEEDAALELFR
jgi:hypothetical protein